jgi:hypothetical protein
LGVIPLDKLLHFLVGAIVAIGLRLSGRSVGSVLSVVAMLAIAKEVNDSFTLNNSIVENGLDIIVTLAYPILIYGIHRIKKS